MSLDGQFNQVYGVDLPNKSIDFASSRYPFVNHHIYNDKVLPYPDNKFNIIFVICEMNHLPTENWLNFFREICHTLNPAVIALFFNHNPYNPVSQYVVRNCEIDKDKDAVLFAPKHVKNYLKILVFGINYTRTVLSIPPIKKILSYVDRMPGYAPFGAQYYMNATKLE